MLLSSKITLRALLTLLLLGATVLPALAEYHWNPFEHMTEDDVESMFLWLLLLGALGLVLGFVVWPMLVAWLTMLVLRRTHPAPYAVRLKPMLRTACLATVAAALAAYLTQSILPYFSFLLELLAPAAGAAYSYFRQLKQLPPGRA